MTTNSFEREKIKQKKSSLKNSDAIKEKLSKWLSFWKSIMFNKMSEQVKIEKTNPAEMKFKQQNNWISVTIKEWGEEKTMNLNIPIWWKIK